ncbi:MAG: hypothetical protein IH820_11225 [Bacteroidetes bacterium]|nr:hypothetical protein [Bacteroidota bacterium]
MTLAEEEEHWRIDEFLDLLHRRRDSVEFFGLTLDSLLERCELPEIDLELRDDFEARISDGRLDIDDRWAMFVRLICGDELIDQVDDFYPRPGFVERVECLIRGMGDDERSACRLVS